MHFTVLIESKYISIHIIVWEKRFIVYNKNIFIQILIIVLHILFQFEVSKYLLKYDEVNHYL